MSLGHNALSAAECGHSTSGNCGFHLSQSTIGVSMPSDDLHSSRRIQLIFCATSNADAVNGETQRRRPSYVAPVVVGQDLLALVTLHAGRRPMMRYTQRRCNITQNRLWGPV